MAISEVTLETTFDGWKEITNQIITALGDSTALSTTDKSNVVVAINEVLLKLGTIASLTTADKTNAVAAINEVLLKLGNIATLSTSEKTNTVGAINEVVTSVGTLSSLTTTIKTSLVNAVNEVQGELTTGLSDVGNDLGDKNTLSTTEKGTFVGAINEIVGSIGDLTSLTTTDKTSIVAAIIEVVASIVTTNTRIDTEVGTLSSLTTNDKASAVAALIEVVASIGALSSLATTAKGSVVAAINEVNNNQVKKSFIPVENREINYGRFSDALELSRVLTTFDATQTNTLLPFNAAVMTEGDRFLDDNSDHGGAGGTLGTDMSLLVTALFNAGRTDAQNGYEFYIMNITAGGSTGSPLLFNAINYYPVVTTADQIIGAIGSTVTWQGWVRLKTLVNGGDVGAVFGDSTVTTYVDGVEVADQSQLIVSDGWVHLRQTTVLANEFMKFFPLIKANVGDVIQVALPSLYAADIDNGMHLGVM